MSTLISTVCIGFAVLPFVAIGIFKLLQWAGQVEDEPQEPKPTATSDIHY